MTDRINDHGGNYVCNCDRLTQPHGTPHKPWCDFLKPRPPVVPDPRRSQHTVAELTGGAPRTDSLTMSDNRERTRVPRIEALNAEITGIPEAIGTSEDFPLTHRPGEYMGISRATTPSRVRPGDQPLPAAASGPAMQDLVIADLELRKSLGIERYGQLLKADDGRDNLKDLYEELMDALVYLRKEIYRRDGR